MKPTKEQLANRKGWLAALESGNYVQGREVLRTKHKVTFCCLGVAAEVAGVKKVSNTITKYTTYAFPYTAVKWGKATDEDEVYQTTSQPPHEWFAARFGVTEEQAMKIQGVGIAMNDGEEDDEGKLINVKTFKQIAKAMRKLFREADVENKEAA